jgi:hypothetical protein
MIIRLFDGKARVGISGEYLVYQSDFADHMVISAKYGKPKGLMWDPNDKAWKIGLDNTVALMDFINWLEQSQQDAFAVQELIENAQNKKFNSKKSSFLDLIWRNPKVKERFKQLNSFESFMNYIDTASIITGEFFVFYENYKTFFVLEIVAEEGKVLIFKHELIDNASVVLSVSTQILPVSGSINFVASYVLKNYSDIYFDTSIVVYRFPKPEVTDAMVLEDLQLTNQGKTELATTETENENESKVSNSEVSNSEVSKNEKNIITQNALQEKTKWYQPQDEEMRVEYE